jgi:hypothetical protein
MTRSGAFAQAVAMTVFLATIVALSYVFEMMGADQDMVRYGGLAVMLGCTVFAGHRCGLFSAAVATSIAWLAASSGFVLVLA